MDNQNQEGHFKIILGQTGPLMFGSDRRMKLKIGMLHGVATGAFVASVFYTSIFAFLDIVGEAARTEYLVAFLGGTVTLFAAFLALIGIQNQIKQAYEIHEAERAAKWRSATAVLPLALSHVCGISEGNMRRYFNMTDLFRGGPVPDQLAQISPDAISTIKESIEFADSTTATHLGKITKTYQVLYSRSASETSIRVLAPHAQEYALSTHNDIDSVIQWATLYALSEHLFDFARGRVEVAEEHWDRERVGSAMFSAGIDLDSFPLLRSVYTERLNADRLGMFEK